ncbi:unnamed protein product [Ixodes pacificus]
MFYNGTSLHSLKTARVQNLRVFCIALCFFFSIDKKLSLTVTVCTSGYYRLRAEEFGVKLRYATKQPT